MSDSSTQSLNCALSERIGFIQGRLSPLTDNRIQSFPWDSWEAEFGMAHVGGFSQMEWTLDIHQISMNPLMTPRGRAEIKRLCAYHSVRIPSVTADCFMQEPFWNFVSSSRTRHAKLFREICDALSDIGGGIVVLPLVDNGRVSSDQNMKYLMKFLNSIENELRAIGVRVALEMEESAEDVQRFIDQLPDCIGINYDIGNSAALGFDPLRELSVFGRRVINVHVKDRLLRGHSVPLGSGSAQFHKVFRMLATIGYTGNLILQTARSTDENHLDTLVGYRDFVRDMIVGAKP